MSRYKHGKHKRDGGRFFAVPDSVLNGSAYVALSAHGRMLLWDFSTSVAESTGRPMEASGVNSSGEKHGEPTAKDSTGSRRIITTNYDELLSSSVANALNFESLARQVFMNLANEFKGAVVHSNVVISTPNGPVEIDAVVETPDVDYVVEIKYGTRPGLLADATNHVKRAAAAYAAYGKQRGTRKPIVPLVVVHSSVKEMSPSKRVFVLRLDPKTGTFVNIEAFRATMARRLGEP